MKPRNHALLDRTNTVLAVIDLQEPFLRNIFQRDIIIERCVFLLEAASILQIPVVISTQYAERMGGLISQIAGVLPKQTSPIIDKLIFSAGGSPQFTDTLSSINREQILICGVETHICVQQTALDLQHLDYQVHVAADAVSSRTLENHKLGMEKLRDCGVIPTAAEGAVMEMLYKAGTPDFKSILKLIK